jgi:hypothetical protein
MTSIDAGVNVSGVDTSIGRTVAPPRRRISVGNILGGFLMTGVFLALSAAAFPIAMVYSFIWWAQH